MKNKLHSFDTLPKWANEYIATIETEIERLQDKLTTTQNMNAVMCDPKRDWFTLPFNHDNDKIIHLWLLDYDQPIRVCSLRKGDLFFVGRGKKDGGNNE
jgi:hypothetical protein